MQNLRMKLTYGPNFLVVAILTFVSDRISRDNGDVEEGVNRVEVKIMMKHMKKNGEKVRPNE